MSGSRLKGKRGRQLLLTMLVAGMGCGSSQLSDPACDEGSLTSSNQAIGTVYQVGPGKPYATLQAVAGLLGPGDVVEVSPGTYGGNIILARAGQAGAPITIRGAGTTRPVLSGGDTTVEFRANHYVLEGFEITGGLTRCVFHHGHNITIRNTVIHDCPSHGIIGAETDSGSLTLEWVEIYRSGQGDRRHPVYMATDETAYPGAVFRMQFCYLHDQNGGNNIKSRAERNEIYYNWIEGGSYRELEMIGPDGQDAAGRALRREDGDVVGNVFRKTQGSFVFRIGNDSTDQGDTDGRYRMAYNTIILQPGQTASVVEVYGSIQSLQMDNNIIFRPGGGTVRVIRDDNSTNAYVQTGSNNWAQTGAAVPAAWQQTKFGAEPGFIDVSIGDVRLASGSACVDASNPSAPAPSGLAIPSPLVQPLYQPPVARLLPVGQAVTRPILGTGPDIGAFEQGAASEGPVVNLPLAPAAPAPSAPAPSTSTTTSVPASPAPTTPSVVAQPAPSVTGTTTSVPATPAPSVGPATGTTNTTTMPGLSVDPATSQTRRRCW